MEIAVEWITKPKSGLTTISLSDLGCKNKKQWDSLSTSEQEKRINKALIETDGGSLRAHAIEWNITT